MQRADNSREQVRAKILADTSRAPLGTHARMTHRNRPTTNPEPRAQTPPCSLDPSSLWVIHVGHPRGPVHVDLSTSDQLAACDEPQRIGDGAEQLRRLSPGLAPAIRLGPESVRVLLVYQGFAPCLAGAARFLKIRAEPPATQASPRTPRQTRPPSTASSDSMNSLISNGFCSTRI